MHIGLIDVDSKIPNLALMKLSAWHKAQGHTTELLKPADVLKGQNLFNKPDKLYAAVVFRENRKIGLRLAWLGADVGGTGWWLFKELPANVEKIKPDYELYGIDYGIGFTSRGCIRNCKFCVVPRKEGKVREACMPDDLLNDKSKRLTLLDNNFLASPNWRNKLQQIIDLDIQIDYVQGLDARLVTNESAAMLAATKRQTFLRFAWDSPKDENEVISGIEKLMIAGVPGSRIMVYVLVNFNTTFIEDLYRVKKLHSMGVDPMVMVYDKKNAPDEIMDLYRWARPQLINTCDFEDYEPRRNKTSA